MNDAPRMTPVLFHLMLSMLGTARHGYALMQEIEVRTGGRVRLGPSSLYYALGRLQDAGWIEEAVAAEAGGDAVQEAPHEERRRYYRLTAAGRERLREETSLLSEILAHARARGLA